MYQQPPYCSGELPNDSQKNVPGIKDQDNANLMEECHGTPCWIGTKRTAQKKFKR
jgi:hypothetical protein